MPDIKLNKMIRKLLNTTIAVVITALSITNCDTAEPPPLPPAPVLDTVTVNIIDQTHRSLTVDVKTTVNNKNWQIELWRNYNNADTLAAEFPVTVGDTTIIDDNNGTGLLLDTEYGYYAVVKDSAGEEQNRTAMQTGRTLAATSHDYTWEEITIGDNGYSNVLYDVWGTDENNVYAVGTVMINDTAYGVLHWDGSTWKPEKRVGGVEAIYGFSENDIWAVGGAVEHFDGTSWKRIDAQTINNQDVVLDDILYYNRGYISLWGTSSSNLYLGSAGGAIIHWDGEKAEVVLDVEQRIRDIWGAEENEIYFVTNGTPNRLYKTSGKEATLLAEGTYEAAEGQLATAFYSVWGVNSREIYFGGSKIYTLYPNIKLKYTVNRISHKIRGTNSNNIFVVGDSKSISHYNGMDWKYYTEELENGIGIDGLFVLEHTVFIVGTDGINARIIIGKSN